MMVSYAIDYWLIGMLVPLFLCFLAVYAFVALLLLTEDYR